MYVDLHQVKNLKQRTVIKAMCDLFDESRGRITENLAITKFNNANGNHTVLYNTLTPELNNKQLVAVGENSGLLFAPVDIQNIFCSEPQFNSSINLITNPSNKQIWEVKSNDKKIQIFVMLSEPSTVAGFSFIFPDSTKTKYSLSGQLGTDNGDLLTEFSNINTSFNTNNQQLFQFQTPIDDVSKVGLTIELVGTNEYTWNIQNFIIYGQMNGESFKSLSDKGIVQWTLIPNMIMRKEVVALKSMQSIDEPNYDSYGSPLLYAPDLDHQYFDNLTLTDMQKITGVRMHSATKLLNTGKEYFVSDTTDNDFKLSLNISPMQEMAKYPDTTETNMPDLIQKGYIKKGGFKNYVLTVYLKLDDIVLDNQYLVWKYGGWLWNPDPGMKYFSKSTDVFIPLSKNENNVISIQTEYQYQEFKEIAQYETDFKIPQGRWIGLQFIRQVQSKDQATIKIRINENPLESDTFDTSKFEDLLTVIDQPKEGHSVASWGGVVERLEITGARLVSIYGLSIFELES